MLLTIPFVDFIGAKEASINQKQSSYIPNSLQN